MSLFERDWAHSLKTSLDKKLSKRGSVEAPPEIQVLHLVVSTSLAAFKMLASSVGVITLAGS